MIVVVPAILMSAVHTAPTTGREWSVKAFGIATGICGQTKDGMRFCVMRSFFAAGAERIETKMSEGYLGLCVILLVALLWFLLFGTDNPR